MYMYACNFHFVNERECILFFTHYDIFLGQMSYVNHQKPRLNEGVIIQIMGSTPGWVESKNMNIWCLLFLC